MADVSTAGTCSKPDCQVAANGVCSEGHAPADSCPYFRPSDAVRRGEDADSDTAETHVPTGEERRPLPTGEALNVLEVEELLRERAASFITIVGDRASGKTTLICAIYDRLLRGPFAGRLFAGSRTLLGLERRSHLARAESGRPAPDTPRTSLAEDLKFFHFSLATGPGTPGRCDLLLSDRAGEYYSKARSNSALLAELVEVVKAARVVLLLDGARLADSVERAGAFQSVRQMLRAFLDGDLLDRTSVVQVVTTKIDLLQNHQETPTIETQIALFQRGLEDHLAPRLRQLSFWRVAARDPRGKFPPAHGVADLLSDWITTHAPLTVPPRPAVPLENEFDRLLLRTPIQVQP